MSMKAYISSIPKWDKILLGGIAFRYILEIAFLCGLWRLFQFLNYLATVYLIWPLNFFLPSMTLLMSLLLIIFTKRWLLKGIAFLSLVIAALDLALSFLFVGWYSPPEELKRVTAPDGVTTAILYHQGITLSSDRIILAIKQPGQLFFPKTLYAGEDKGDLDVTWMNNHRLMTTARGELVGDIFDINDPTRIEP